MIKQKERKKKEIKKKEMLFRMTVAFTERQRKFLQHEANGKFEGRISQMFREIVNFYELHHPHIFKEDN